MAVEARTAVQCSVFHRPDHVFSDDLSAADQPLLFSGASRSLERLSSFGELFIAIARV